MTFIACELTSGIVQGLGGTKVGLLLVQARCPSCRHQWLVWVPVGGELRFL